MIPTSPPINCHGERSLPKEIEKLAVLTQHQRENLECSIMMFTETWLTTLTPDTSWGLGGFELMQLTMENGKKKEGLPVFVDDRWCNSGLTTIIEQICSKDTELFTLKPDKKGLLKEKKRIRG